jgi:hypothetical protein
MPIFKRILLVIITPLFTLLLLALAIDWGVVHTVGSPASVKQVVNDSGLTKQLVPNLLKQADTISTPVGNVSLTDPAVKQAAEQAITPQIVQSNVSQTIDNLYAWLDGTRPDAQLKLDFSSSQDSLANNVAAAVQQKAGSLPVCTTSFTSTSFDLSSATCLPRGLSPAALAAAVRDKLASGNTLSDKAVSFQDLKTGSPSLPKQYQRVKKSPLLLAILTFVVGLAIVFLSRTRLSGLRHLGVTLVVVGMLMLIFAWGFNHANVKYIQPKISVDNTELTQDIRNVVNDLTQRIDKTYWEFGSLYFVLGLGLVLTPLFWRPRPAATGNRPEPAKAAEANEEPVSKEATKTAVAKKKTTKINVL